MKKRFLATFLSMLLIFSSMPAITFAAETDVETAAAYAETEEETIAVETETEKETTAVETETEEETIAAETETEEETVTVETETEKETVAAEDTEMGAAAEDESNEDTNEEEVTFDSVQAMMDALPDAEDITEDNISDVEALLDAIDEAKSALYQAGGDVDSLDMSRYDAACEALAVFSESDESGTLLLGSTPSLTASGTKLSSNGGSLSAGNYYLSGNVTLKNNVTIPANTTVTIDLNGKTLTGSGSGSVITVYGTLNLKDTSTNGNGKITGGSSSLGAGVRVEGGVFNMTGGVISGNIAASWGGGVYIREGGSFTMTGGTISGNSAKYGGGVYVYNGDFYMSNSGTLGSGTISGNTASSSGGGVAIDSGGGLYMSGGTISDNTAAVYDGGGVYVEGSFEMYGGTISGNSAYYGCGVSVTNTGNFVMSGGTIKNHTANGSGGVGVYVVGSFTMTGGTITDNSVSYGSGAGVYFSGRSGGSFTVSGSPVITGNSDTGENCSSNVFLASGDYNITLGGLSSGASIGVTSADSSALRIQITSTETETNYYETAAGYFSSDNSNYIVRSNSAGYLELCVNNLLDGSVAISGTPTYGETLTAALSNEVPSGVTYQWMRGTEAISGATNSTYTLTAADVGKTITVVVSHTGYAGTLSASTSCEVQKATVTASISGTTTKVYDGTTDVTDTQNLSITLSGLAGDDAPSVTADFTFKDKDVGTEKTITASAITLTALSDCYQLDSTAAEANVGTITAATVTASISGSTTKVYDGTTEVTDASGLSITLSGVMDADKGYVSASAESYAYTDANAGEAKTITADNVALSGSAAGNYILAGTSVSAAAGNITARALSENDFSVNTDLETYTGSAITKAITSLSGLTEETDYTVFYSDNVDAGTAVVTVSGMGNYTDKLTYTFTINKAAPTVSLSGVESKTYDGTAVSDPTVSVTLAGSETYAGTPAITWYSVAGDGTETALTGAPFTAGSYKVVVTVSDAGSNYEIASASEAFTIGVAEQSISYSEIIVTKHINDTAFTNALTQTTLYGTISYASDDADVATVDENGEVTIVGAGTAIITATAASSDDYNEATASYTLTVTAHSYGEPSFTWSEDGKSCTASFTCADCGDVQTVTAAITSTVKTAATCTGAGITLYTATVECNGQTYTDTKEISDISTTGHSYASVVTEPTCTEKGYTTYTCSVCGDSYTADETDATGHTSGEAVIENEITATCTVVGSYDSVVYCKVCGEELSRDIVTVPAMGHSFGEWETITSPTCEGSGSEQRTCTVCGYTETRDIDPTGHTWGKGVVTKEPTGTASGTQTYTCTVCGKTRTVTIPATGGAIKDGLVLDEDHVFRYYQNNVFAEDYVGVVPYDGGLFFIKNGLIDFDANELCLYEDVWYYVSLGQVQLQYTGLAIHDGAWFYITEGILDTTVNGLIPYDGERFLVAAGRLVFEYSGLWLNSVTIGGNDQWYFLAAGMVCKVSQVVMYDGAFFVVVDGILDTGYNGTIVYGGAVFTVVNGQLYAA